MVTSPTDAIDFSSTSDEETKTHSSLRRAPSIISCKTPVSEEDVLLNLETPALRDDIREIREVPNIVPLVTSASTDGRSYISRAIDPSSNWPGMHTTPRASWLRVSAEWPKKRRTA